MTREEAIKELTGLAEYLDKHVHAIGRESVDMAISALRANVDIPPNDPLTLEELRKMDGEAVGVELIIDTVEQKDGWSICYFDSYSSGATQRWTTWTLWYEDYGKTWQAYRRKPGTPLDRKEDT